MRHEPEMAVGPIGVPKRPSSELYGDTKRGRWVDTEPIGFADINPDLRAHIFSFLDSEKDFWKMVLLAREFVPGGRLSSHGDKSWLRSIYNPFGRLNRSDRIAARALAIASNQIARRILGAVWEMRAKDLRFSAKEFGEAVASAAEGAANPELALTLAKDGVLGRRILMPPSSSLIDILTTELSEYKYDEESVRQALSVSEDLDVPKFIVRSHAMSVIRSAILRIRIDKMHFSFQGLGYVLRYLRPIIDEDFITHVIYLLVCDSGPTGPLPKLQRGIDGTSPLKGFFFMGWGLWRSPGSIAFHVVSLSMENDAKRGADPPSETSEAERIARDFYEELVITSVRIREALVRNFTYSVVRESMHEDPRPSPGTVHPMLRHIVLNAQGNPWIDRQLVLIFNELNPSQKEYFNSIRPREEIRDVPDHARALPIVDDEDSDEDSD